jgi:hypothetical protein
MPGSRRSNPAGSNVGGNRRAEFQNPSADRFIADTNATFRKHFLNVTKAQRKAKVEPDGPLDYYRQKSTACVGYFAHSTTNTPRQADRRVNVTMPNLELVDCNLMICFKFSMNRDWWFQSTSSSHHLNQHQESRIITGTCEVIRAKFTLILLIAHNLFRQGYA